MRPTWRVVSVALLMGSSCDKTVPTPPGVLVDIPVLPKLSVTDWTVGAATGPLEKVSKSYRYDSIGPTVRFRISFEHGASELVEAKPKANKPPPVNVPRSIRIEVLENTAWAMTAKCDDDLKVPLEVNSDGTAAYPKSVWASCSLVMKRKNGDITVGPSIDVYGDGKLVVKTIGTEERLTEE
jgi:hypothetical protein